MDFVARAQHIAVGGLGSVGGAEDLQALVGKQGMAVNAADAAGGCFPVLLCGGFGLNDTLGGFGGGFGGGGGGQFAFGSHHLCRLRTGRACLLIAGIYVNLNGLPRSGAWSGRRRGCGGSRFFLGFQLCNYRFDLRLVFGVLGRRYSFGIDAFFQ